MPTVKQQVREDFILFKLHPHYYVASELNRSFIKQATYVENEFGLDFGSDVDTAPILDEYNTWNSNTAS
jgi:hypothetical protein